MFCFMENPNWVEKLLARVTFAHLACPLDKGLGVCDLPLVA